MTPEERILDHYENPYHRYVPQGTILEDSYALSHAENDTCGDWIECHIFLRLRDKRIDKIWWNGAGCCFSQAAASMVAERFEAVRLEDAKAFTQDGMLELFEVDVETERLECILVSFNSFKNALEKLAHE